MYYCNDENESITHKRKFTKTDLPVTSSPALIFKSGKPNVVFIKNHPFCNLFLTSTIISRLAFIS
jgi:hypothetical protein